MTQSATERYLAQYRAFAGNGASGAPAWLRDLREQAIARFAASGFPTTRQEQWRFTNVAPIAETPFTLSAVRWDVGQLSPGVVVTTLGEALLRSPELVRQHLGRYASSAANPFTALGTAFLADGILVHVPDRTVVDTPIRLSCSIPAGTTRPMIHPRLLVILGREAQARVVELYEGDAPDTSLTNAVTEIVLGEGARLDHCRVQRQGERGYHVATSQSSQARDSRLVFTTVTLGASLTRHDVNGVLDGSGTYLVLNGLSVVSGHQHVDYHTTIEHAQPHAESHEYFNGVFDGESHGVFNGRIIVRPGAQRTDSKQTNNNLLLSRDARADSQPQLEIYADDVKCTHGSTVGPVDETALFYLRSRGVGEVAARGLLTYGFVAEILDRIEIPEVRKMLDHELRERFRVAERELAS